MGITLTSKKRKCDVLTNGPIAELGFITGPVFNCNLSTDTIIRLVSNGKKVFEINPLNRDEKVLLTIATCSESPFESVKNKSIFETESLSVEPVVSLPKPDKVIVASTEKVITDPHLAFLAEIGVSEDAWRRMPKSERRRLRAQYEHTKQEQNVQEQIEEINETINENTTNVIEEKSVDATMTEVETSENISNDVEEAVETADM